jgi:hypothetical protein
LLKFALNANRSLARRSAARHVRSAGNGCHDPYAAIATGAHNVIASSLSSKAMLHRKLPAPPLSDIAVHGCSTQALTAWARCSNSTSKCSRPSARPQGWLLSSEQGNAALTACSPHNNATRRNSAPAIAANASPMPSTSSSGKLLAAMHSPQTLRRGKSCFSIRATDQPACASRIAAVEPDAPAPMMIAS